MGLGSFGILGMTGALFGVRADNGSIVDGGIRPTLGRTILTAFGGGVLLLYLCSISIIVSRRWLESELRQAVDFVRKLFLFELGNFRHL